MINRLSLLSLFCTLLLLFSCKKGQTSTNVPIDQSKGIYMDSVFYIQSSEYNVKPAITVAGTYASSPEGLEIDNKTGEINVNKSETGLKYRVTFTSAVSGETKASQIIISGINYLDKIYNLAAGDSIAEPIYNANAKLLLPNTGTANLFDENGGCKKAGIAVSTTTAKINLAQSVRSQAIDTGATEEVKLAYRINDGSNKALNGLNVKIYFYRNVKEIPQYLTDLLNARKTSILSIGPADQPMPGSMQSLMSIAAAKVQSVARPRPPCIIVVSR